MNRIMTADEAEGARRVIAARLEAAGELFLCEGRARRRVELRAGEWELTASASSLVFSYWGDAGVRAWRVGAWRFEGDVLLLEATRRMGAERATLELVPRARVATAREVVADARRSECERVAAKLFEHAESLRACAKLERAWVSAGARRGEPGRWARVLLILGRERVAATAPVVAARADDAESFLASALLWLARLDERQTRATRPSPLWLAAPRPLAEVLRDRLPLLREHLRERVSVLELDGAEPNAARSNAAESNNAESNDVKSNDFESNDRERALATLHAPDLEELLREPVQRLLHLPSKPFSELTESVVALAPDEIDAVRTRRGETLRFRGLTFARVRSVAGREQLWFGVEGARRRTPLDESNAHDLLKLVEELREHRRADPPDRRHALYRAAHEAWLESLLRRDVTRLDPGLRLAPLHAQFRASRAGSPAARPVDLLALRHDGRLVVIELKVSEDAALALQGADYWRRVEAHRRQGNITRARLFGDVEIADEPALLYLAAPMLRFHRSFHTLARTLRPDIETYRLDLNEDWRAGVRVVRLCALT
ncbi:MAG TPA: hypothetical protein VGP08_23655 [Pyrinomonadaceae bacterium]|jgi:hypothetical protein|nr:hypothetical protein [Pyrinomonadaceae bacterium]